MKKAVGHLIPFIEKGKEEQEKKLRKLGCWDDNVCWNTIISEVFFFLKKENDHAEPSIPTGSTNDFLLFDPFSPFQFMFIHLPLIHIAPPPRLLIDYKIANDLPISGFIYGLLCICYCFYHLIGFFSVTSLSLLY